MKRVSLTPASKEHLEGPIDYSTKHTIPEDSDKAPPAPPIGGPHNPKWLRCDVYDAPVPNEYAVHSLERGAVWVAYRPGLPAGQIRRLAALSDITEITREYLIVSPYEGIPAPIVAVSWGSWMTAEDAGDDLLPVFVHALVRNPVGGKAMAPCRTGGVLPQEARQELKAWCQTQGSSSRPGCAALAAS